MYGLVRMCDVYEIFKIFHIMNDVHSRPILILLPIQTNVFFSNCSLGAKVYKLLNKLYVLPEQFVL